MNIRLEKYFPGKKYLADTTAAIIFFTAFGIFNELVLVGMPQVQSAKARMGGILVCLVYGRVYGIYRDFFTPKLQRFFSPTTVDTLLFSIFDLIIGVALLFLSGAGSNAVIRGLPGLIAFVCLGGRPYGIWLDYIRRSFGLNQNSPKV